MAETRIHTGEGGRRKGPIWKPLVKVLVVILILGLAAGGGVVLKSWQNRTKPPTPKQATVASQEKSLDGNLNGAQAEIDKALQRSDLTNDDKYTLYYQRGTNFQNAGKNKEALDSFKLAVGYKETDSLYRSMGAVAEAMGDNAEAISYYEKALPLISGPVADEDKQVVQFKIDYLKQKL